MGYQEQVRGVGSFGRPGSQAKDEAEKTSKAVMGALAQMPEGLLPLLNDIGGSVIVSVIAVPEGEGDDRCQAAHLLIGVHGKGGSPDRFKGDKGFVESHASKMSAAMQLILALSQAAELPPAIVCAQILATLERSRGL